MKRFAYGVAMLLAVASWPIHGPAQQMTPAPRATPMAPDRQYDAFDDRWHASITPYVWLPGISGDLNFHRPPIVGTGLAIISIATGPSNYLSFLNFGALVAGEVRKNAFDVAGDVIWLNMSHHGSSNVTITGPGGNVEIPISSSVGWRLTTTMWELEPGLVFAHGSGGNGIYFAGVRSVSVTSAASWAFTGPIDLVPLTGNVADSASITDFITGARGRLGLGSGWFMPLYGDVGWGNQTTTNQWYAGIGHVQRWGSLELFYRQLYFNQTGQRVLQNIQLSGLTLGATINL